MKLRVTFKSPDAIANALQDIGIPPDTYGHYGEHSHILDNLEKWVEYEELITIEFDLNNS